MCQREREERKQSDMALISECMCNFTTCKVKLQESHLIWVFVCFDLNGPFNTIKVMSNRQFT